MDKNYYGYIYRTDCLTTGDFYLGQHRGDFDPLYFGSGIRIKRSLKKHGESNFYVKPIMFCRTRKEINLQEIKIITKHKLKHGKSCMNIARGGEGSCPVPGTPEYKEYIKVWSNRGKLTNSVSHFGGVKRGEHHPNYGAKRSQEFKDNMSKIKTGITYEMRWGKERSDKARKAKSNQQKELYRTGKRKRPKPEHADKMLQWRKDHPEEMKRIYNNPEYKEKKRVQRYVFLNKMWGEKSEEFFPRMETNKDYTINSFAILNGCSSPLSKNVLNLLVKKKCVKVINNKYYRRI